MKNKNILLIVLVIIIIIIAVAGYLIINSYSDENEINEILLGHFLSGAEKEVAKGIITTCNEENTKVEITTISDNSAKTYVLCSCGIECAYSVDYDLTKVNGKWEIEKVGQLSIA